jgi:hypothetical protein
MWMAAQLSHAKSNEKRCRHPPNAGARYDHAEAESDGDRRGDSERMAESERTERAPDGPAISRLHSQRDGKEPTHSGVEAVESTQSE